MTYPKVALLSVPKECPACGELLLTDWDLDFHDFYCPEYKGPNNDR